MQEIQQALDTMHRTILEALAKVSTLKKAANMMATGAGLPEPYDDVEADTHAGAAFRFRPDQFHSEKAPASAARAYLALRGKDRGATTVDDIYDALARGAYDFGGMKEAEAKQSLRIALAKDGKVHKLPNGYIGLREWYGIADEEKAGGKKPDKPAEKAVDKTGEVDDDFGGPDVAAASSPNPAAATPTEAANGAKKKRGKAAKAEPDLGEKAP